jgi:hypothetical protein
MNIVYVLNRAALHYLLNETISVPRRQLLKTVLTVYSLPPALILNRNFAFCSRGVSAHSAF